MSILTHLLPHHVCSRLMGALCHSKISFLKNAMIKKFITHYQVDMSLAVEPNSDYYESFNAFFTRRLKPNTRPITTGEWDIASPVDGVVSQFGRIKNDRLFQAKGLEYTLLDLCHDDKQVADLFSDGHFMTLYLSPKDYHRVHMPFAGQLRSMHTIPGKLFSVNHYSAQTIKNLFARNERVLTLYDTIMGPMAVIFVGAFFVGSVSTKWAGVVNRPYQNNHQVKHYAETGNHALSIQRGEELGNFNMGSTVIVLLPNIDVTWEDKMIESAPIQMGERLARFSQS